MKRTGNRYGGILLTTKRRITGLTAVLTAAALLFSSQTAVQASAANIKYEDQVLFSAEPVKESFEKGEDVQFITTVTNRTFDDLRYVTVWVEEKGLDGYYGAGEVKNVYPLLGFRDTVTETLSISEDAGTVEAGEKAGIFSFIVKLFARIYSRLWVFFSTLRTALTSSGDRSGLLTPRRTRTVGTQTVICGGEEREFVFRLSAPCAASHPSFEAVPAGQTGESFSLSTKIKPDGFNGIYFGGSGPENTEGALFFYLSSSLSTAGLARLTSNGPEIITRKNIRLTADTFYDCLVTWQNGRLRAWVYNNPLDSDPYPVFDVEIPIEGTYYGKYAQNTQSVSVIAQSEPEKSPTPDAVYVNPVVRNGADPCILYADGLYYMYSTNSGNGFEADVSSDLAHWERIGIVADKNDIFGEHSFWAPEVFGYNGLFYMFYTANGEGICAAVSDSPAGPFRKLTDGYLLDNGGYDGYVFFDDDGRIYLYYSCSDKWGNHEIRGVELEKDLVTVKTETDTGVCAPQGWEGYMNEGPCMLKHNGTYYLTYSGSTWERKTYAVGLAVGTEPLGKFRKDQSYPILKYNSLVHGTGHHNFFYTPEGELFIVYHCHPDTTVNSPRSCCIDRAKFVPSDSGHDLLEIYGPTTTAQPLP